MKPGEPNLSSKGHRRVRGPNLAMRHREGKIKAKEGALRITESVILKCESEQKRLVFYIWVLKGSELPFFEG